MAAKIYIIISAFFAALLLHSISNASLARTNWSGSANPANGQDTNVISELLSRRAVLTREIAELEHIVKQLKQVGEISSRTFVTAQ